MRQGPFCYLMFPIEGCKSQVCPGTAAVTLKGVLDMRGVRTEANGSSCTED